MNKETEDRYIQMHTTEYSVQISTASELFRDKKILLNILKKMNSYSIRLIHAITSKIDGNRLWDTTSHNEDNKDDALKEMEEIKQKLDFHFNEINQIFNRIPYVYFNFRDRDEGTIWLNKIGYNIDEQIDK